jgi:hypothetical protein
MLKISSNVWSHLSRGSGERNSVLDVLASKPREVDTFPQLVREIAELSYRNPEQVLFFRGQSREHLKAARGEKMQSSFYPEIYRSPGRSLSNRELGERFDRLDMLSARLHARLKTVGIQGHEKLAKFPELIWAILQHYNVCATPLLDLTHSLRVAASFALNGSESGGVIYAFGLPHPNGSITYSVEHELLNIRLLSICPPEAQRPYFQEGFLVGSFPARRLRKYRSLDVGVRLIAKFKLPVRDFWNSDFHAIPTQALYPLQDQMEEICMELTR